MEGYEVMGKWRRLLAGKLGRCSIKIHGISFPVKVGDFGWVMGVRNCGTRVELKGCFDVDDMKELQRKLFGDNGDISVDRMKQMIVAREEADDIFKIYFVLYFLTVLLCPNTPDTVDLKFHTALNDASSISSKNWASLCFEHLVDGYVAYKVSKTLTEIDTISRDMTEDVLRRRLLYAMRNVFGSGVENSLSLDNDVEVNLKDGIDLAIETLRGRPLSPIFDDRPNETESCKYLAEEDLVVDGGDNRFGIKRDDHPVGNEKIGFPLEGKMSQGDIKLLKFLFDETRTGSDKSG
ncbi:hypothetical protein ACLB2K_040645 [Fragaria x ananassa]